MLHAFNQKNARRIFLARHDEHDNQKAEDAATSMVFSPLAFMTAAEALTCLAVVLDGAAIAAINGRAPIGHRLELWPQGLVAGSSEDLTLLSRCEPDLVITFDFAEGSPVAFIGEMKWDWPMGQEELAIELRRESEAVRRSTPTARQVLFVVSKKRYRPIPGVTMLTWREFAGRLALIEKREPRVPSSIWAGLVRTFLAVANQHTFTGFPSVSQTPEWSKRPAFWEPK
jgi:hypothetical protein